MKFRKLLTIVVFYSSLSSQAMELTNGALCDSDLSNKSKLEVDAAYVIGDYFTSLDERVDECIGWYAPTNKKIYFLENTSKILKIDSETKKLESLTSLERWVNEPLDELLITEYIGINRKFSSSYGTSTRYSLGCLAETSMRYGDIDQDSKEDLVLLLGPDFVLFSPDHERIVFSLRYATDNWMDKVDTEIYFDDYGFSTPEDMPFSQWDVLADLREPDPSFRGYAKVFIGDVDGDEHKDFIVWRKLYRSNMRRDGVDGFHLLSDTFFHYERDLEAQAESEAGITGEYLPQDTSEEDIQNWLAENILTWSKGYPSKSECPGEEGQLIPEMHDPLLNDTDVLK